MKEIQVQLIKPFVQKMEMEWQVLYDNVRHSKVPEAVELRPLAENQLNQLKKFLDPPTLEGFEFAPTTDSVHQFLRQSKMDFRSAKRRWVRHLVSCERIKTRYENHLAKAAGLASD